MSERVKAFRGINGLRPTRWAGPLHLFHGALTWIGVIAYITARAYASST